LLMVAMIILAWNILGQPGKETLADFGDALANQTRDWDFGDLSSVLGNLTDLGEDFAGQLMDQDPFLSNNETQSWPIRTRDGLNLELVSALEDRWSDEFDMAVSDWDDGNPNVLSLSTRIDTTGPNCDAVDEALKVCNGNFGDTGWLGINEIMTINDYIQSSVAKMNEYYLFNADQDTRQYTMCHELGHGFGLPHTDENFNNADLGNCMDYTHKHENNLRPDESNFNRLMGLYGVIPENRRLKAATSLHDKKKGIISSPKLRQQYDQAIQELSEHTRRMTIQQPYSRDTSNESLSWRVLQEHSYGGHYARELDGITNNDDKYMLHVHILFSNQ